MIEGKLIGKQTVLPCKTREQCHFGIYCLIAASNGFYEKQRDVITNSLLAVLASSYCQSFLAILPNEGILVGSCPFYRWPTLALAAPCKLVV